MNTKVAVTDGQSVSPWVALARHAVAIAVLLAVYAVVAPKGYNFLDDWFVAVLIVLVMAALVAGLAALFFTASQKGKWATNARNTAWVVTGLLLVDPALHALRLPASAKVPAAEVASLIEDPAPTGATEAAPKSPDPSFNRAMDTAVGEILASAKAAGTIDYSTDVEAAKQFDGYLAELVDNPAFKGKPAAEIAHAAHQSVLTFRSLAGRKIANIAALPLRPHSATPECASRPGETAESRRKKLAAVRKDYPFLANRDDVEFVEALHQALYKDLPLACVADALGVVLPAARTY